ncbi:MAG: transcriptional regulator [gamma proteobacterium symbiont of Taylorina sp.]|nr:transcriptional regulator [gamma proteobacterium symbiont of Taylorina sp.]
MTIEIKSGSLSDFFASAKETAKEIDSGKQLTKKNTVWVDPKDLLLLLKPERTNLVQYLRKEKRVIFSKLLKVLNRSPASLNKDLKILSKYDLIHISRESNPGHGIHKIIESSLGNQKIDFRVQI